MSSLEDRVNALLGLITLDSPPRLSITHSHCLYESFAVNTIIDHLKEKDIDSAFNVYIQHGDIVRSVIYTHLLYISDKGYGDYTLNVGVGFI